MAEMKKIGCFNCKFYLRTYPSQGLACHRYPQSAGKQQNDWCGEWKERSPQPEEKTDAK